MVSRTVPWGCVNEHTVPAQPCKIQPTTPLLPPFAPAARAKRVSTAVGVPHRRAAARSPAVHALTTAFAASVGVEQMIPMLTEEPPELLVAVVVDAARCAAPPLLLLLPPHAARAIAAPSSPAPRAQRINRGPRGGR